MNIDSWYAVKAALALDDDPKSLQAVAEEAGLSEENARVGLGMLLDRSMITTTPGFKYRRAR